MNNGINYVTTETQIAKPRKSRKGVYVGFVLLVFAFSIGALLMNNGILGTLLARLFGPPKVNLQETYAEKPDGQIFDHAVFTELLSDYVDKDGWVDYSQLKAAEERLNRYIDSIGKAEIENLGRNERLAFLINAYNAFTLKLIVEHYPLDSIKEIPGSKRWDAVRWNLAGTTLSLNQIEHEQIRPHFKEPRIHFALVCAAIGCPPLRNEAYNGQALEEQLDSQCEYVHQHATWFVYDSDGGRLKLTQLYNWYGDDFVQVSGSVVEFAAKCSAEIQRDLESENVPRIQWLDYDWDLNDSLKKQQR